MGITNVCLQYNNHDEGLQFDYSTTGYFGEGIWSSFFALVGATIGLVGSFQKIPETFTALYRLQAAMVSKNLEELLKLVYEC